MTDARKYIDDEFETMRGISIKGTPNEGLNAVLKMVFIAGMSAALGFDGTDVELGDAIKPALLAISARYGGRTIFPIDTNSQQRHDKIDPELSARLAETTRKMGEAIKGDLSFNRDWERSLNGPTTCHHAYGKGWLPYREGQEKCEICHLVRYADPERKQGEVSEGLADDQR